MKVAIFDVDGTLVRHSTERAFWRFLFRSRRQGPRQLLSFLACHLRYLPTWGIHAAKKNKAYLAGLRTEEIGDLGERFIAQWLPENRYEPAIARLRRHQHDGHTVMLLSGSPEFLVRPIAQALDVDQVCGTVPAQHDGVFQAVTPVVHPFGVAKRSLAERFLRDAGVRWRDVSAYGDSRYDLPLLEAVGTPVAVEPDRVLRETALARGWEIISTGPVPGVAAQDRT